MPQPPRDQPHAILDPVKWAGVGAIGTAALAALTYALFVRSPRPLRPLVETTVVTEASRPQPALPKNNPPASRPGVVVSRVDEAETVGERPDEARGKAFNTQSSTQPQRAQPAVSLGSINVNTASAAELELLPQIGPALAARIIAYRNEHGAFRSVADLDKVRGIGPKTLEKLKGRVRFE